MALFRRAPRGVYRVFSEEDFLAHGSAAEELVEPVAPRRGAHTRLHRIAAVAMVAGAAAVLGGGLFLHPPVHPQATDRPRDLPARQAPEAPLYGASHRAGERQASVALPHRLSRGLDLRPAVASARPRIATTLPPSSASSPQGGPESPQPEGAEFRFER